MSDWVIGLREIEEFTEQADSAREALLINHGWRYETGFPDFIWRWTKNTKRGRLTCKDAKEAIVLEAGLQAYGDRLPGEH